MAYSSLPALHRDAADRLGPRVALRHKRHGLYRDLTWRDYRRQADGAAAALIGLGLRPGDRVGLLSENRVEWLVADVAILSAGAADVPLHAPLSPAQVEFQLAHSGCRGVVVSDQAQADKVLAVRENLPDLEWIASFDPIDVGGRLAHFTWDGLVQRGRLDPGSLAEVPRREAALGRDDLATLIYTSGTTGRPKGVMLTHGNLLSNAEATQRSMAGRADDVLLSWLPYSHIYARTVDHYLTMLAGSTVALAESMDTLVINLAEVQPTWMTAVPRFYEKIWSLVSSLPPDARAARLRGVFGPRIRHLSSGGAPLPTPVAEGFQQAGLMLLQGYGLTESSPVITFNRLDCHRLGSVGRAIEGVEVKVADDGEILTRGPHVMAGYWKDPEATAQAIDPDGWLRTGDVGRLDDEGFLFITDRKKDLIVTSLGKNVAPAEIERLLTSDPYIDQAVVYGDRRPFVSALIAPNLPMLRAKAEELGDALEPDGEFLRPGPIRDFLAGRIDRLMQAVSNPERVKAFLALARPFRIDADELTATLKVRRRFLIEKYRDQLDRLYEGKDA